jgi:hypothetical protein
MPNKSIHIIQNPVLRDNMKVWTNPSHSGWNSVTGFGEHVNKHTGYKKAGKLDGQQTTIKF